MASDPSESYFQLISGADEDDMQQLSARARLTIASLARCKLERACLAYLSACETANVQNIDLVDENIHLAATMQAVGFIHTIGTLWQAEDEAAGDIATVFYSNLASSLAKAATVDEAVFYRRG